MISFVFTCTPDDAGRIDRAVLARAPASSRALVNDAFARGAVRAGTRILKKSDRAAAGMEVSVEGLAETPDRAVSPEPDVALDVVRSDAALVAVDKPAGVACHPISPGEKGTLAAALVARFPECAAVGPDPLMCGLLHRIDGGTSGLLLAARTGAAYDAVRAQFAGHTAVKTYLALVEGPVDEPGGISGFLAHSSSFRGRMRCVSGAALPGGEKPMFAETFYRPLETRGDATLLEITIKTGVTHQIRCQLASIGHPVAGDALYGSKLAPPAAGGHALHSYAVAFVHPSTGKPVVFTGRRPAWAGEAVF